MVTRDRIHGTRITVDLASEDLYRALRVLAASHGRSMRDVVGEAIRDWLEKQEDLEDSAAIAAVRDDQVVDLDDARREWK